MNLHQGGHFHCGFATANLTLRFRPRTSLCNYYLYKIQRLYNTIIHTLYINTIFVQLIRLWEIRLQCVYICINDSIRLISDGDANEKNLRRWFVGADNVRGRQKLFWTIRTGKAEKFFIKKKKRFNIFFN